MIDWRTRYKYRPVTDINLVKPGMSARLIVGDDEIWCDDAWIIGRKDQTFTVKSISTDSKEIDVIVPRNKNEDNDDDDELENYRICRGYMDWFLFNLKGV